MSVQFFCLVTVGCLKKLFYLKLQANDERTDLPSHVDAKLRGGSVTRTDFDSERTAPWFRTIKNRDVSTGPLACLFAILLAPLIHLLAP